MVIVGFLAVYARAGALAGLPDPTRGAAGHLDHGRGRPSGGAHRPPPRPRHAAVPTRLDPGVGAAKAAERAGRSVEVLRRVHAQRLDGDDSIADAR
ncbi:hypothetical protein GCM10023224_09820 [Streptomonospora halophila]|uniref:Uncharacterized protein n=1 Tax=Streptomonospora halophila TaxID=427369 RepID=A0ABP9G7M9_9ACTN